jgi:hypothetical protein
MFKLVNLKVVRYVFAPALSAVLLAGIAGTVVAKDDEAVDLTDNEMCLDCHIDEEHLGLLEVDGPQVHNPEDGSLKNEDHAEAQCIECHVDIIQVDDHREDITRTVDCLNCHEEMPEEDPS